MNLKDIAASFFGGTEAPDTLISGFRDVHSGGIAVGSKVIGSGSAATSLPPLSVAPGASFSGGATSAGTPAWLPWAVAAIAAVAAVLIFALFRRPRS